MIKLERVRTKKAIPSSFRGRTPRNRLVSLMKSARAQLAVGKPVKLDIKSKWTITKEQLLLETHNKCAYCESDMAAVAFGDVEHYRPKSVYWWLAYVYDNYLAACAICNRRFKGKKFEFSGDQIAMPDIDAATTDAQLKKIAKTLIPDPLKAGAVAAYEAAHRTEAPLIPNPYIDDPEPIFNWEVFTGNGEVEVVANPGFPESAAILDACERIYGLNRPQLQRRRFQRFVFYETLRKALEDLPPTAPSRGPVEKLVETFKRPDSEYTAMVRFFDAAGV